MNRNDRVLIYLSIAAVLMLIAIGITQGCAPRPSLCVDKHSIEQC